MTFINIFLCDFRNGVLRKWRFYLFVGIFFSILAVFAYCDFEAALRMEPSPVTSKATVGDYLCFLFGGTSAGNVPIELVDKNNIVNSMFQFTFPSRWILIYLILLLLTLEYPYDNLMGFGKSIIVLSTKIQYWWMSKFLWIVVSSALYFIIAIGCFSLMAVVWGAEWSLNIGTYYPYFRFDSYDYVTEPPWNIIPTLLMLWPVGIGLCTMQLTLSMMTSRFTGYTICAAVLIVSAYVQNAMLFPNVSMFARSIEVVTNGQIAWIELIVIAWISVVSLLVGFLYMKKADIINKQR